MTRNNFSDSAYLRLLAERTKAGLESLPKEVLSRHETAVLRFHTKEGGFRGRRGGADLYYTAFAARALHALGAFSGRRRSRIARLRSDEIPDGLSQSILSYIAQQEPKTIIDALDLLNISLLLGCSPVIESTRILKFIESFRTSDGGYGKRMDAVIGSLYHSFLAVLCFDLLGVFPPARDGLVEFAINRRQSDGGFSDGQPQRIPPTEGSRGKNVFLPRPYRRVLSWLSAVTKPACSQITMSSTNVTAAGLSLLSVFGALSEDVGACDRTRDSAASYLLSMQHGSGGWLASKNVPLPDLLSTYTASVSLLSIQRLEPTVLAKALAFVRMCEGQDGGFSAGEWDGTVDVEYTYYGLGVIAFAAVTPHGENRGRLTPSRAMKSDGGTP